MPPTLRSAILIARCNDIGDCADSISWWEPGVLVGDGVSLWELALREAA